MKTATKQNTVNLHLSNGETRIFKSSATIPQIRDRYILGANLPSGDAKIQVNSLTIY
jgi:hypothetical protein